VPAPTLHRLGSSIQDGLLSDLGVASPIGIGTYRSGSCPLVTRAVAMDLDEEPGWDAPTSAGSLASG
jgi:hypothetical protein